MLAGGFHSFGWGVHRLPITVNCQYPLWCLRPFFSHITKNVCRTPAASVLFEVSGVSPSNALGIVRLYSRFREFLLASVGGAASACGSSTFNPDSEMQGGSDPRYNTMVDAGWGRYRTTPVVESTALPVIAPGASADWKAPGGIAPRLWWNLPPRVVR